MASRAPSNLRFMVIATQNPIEHEGTYPLPAAQLDRFMIRLRMGYPERDKELEMLDVHGDHSTYDDLEPAVKADDVVRMAEITRGIHVADVIRSYLVDIADASRSDPEIQLGAHRPERHSSSSGPPVPMQRKRDGTM